MSNKLVKKIASVGLAVSTAVWLSGAAMIVPVASAQTIDLNALLLQLQQIQALIYQLQSGGTTGGVSTACTFTKDLTLGSTGDDVKCLQQYLNAAGYAVAQSGVGSAGSETTYFGPLTKAALARWQAAKDVSPAVGYFGPISRTKYTSLAGTVTPTTPGAGVVVPSSGIVLALAAGNPLSTTVPKGTSGVEYMKFTVAGHGTVSSLVFKRKGIGSTNDFASTGFYLYEGNNRLTSGRSINSTSHEVSFLNLNLAVDGVKVLSLRADVSSSATPNNNSYFELVSAVGDPTPSGTLVGSTMTIGGQQVGGITATSTGSLSNPYVGQVGAQVSEFKLTASSTEDVLIKQIALTQGGSISNVNLSNFVLKDGAGNTLATAASVGAKDLVTFVFDTAYLLEKGQERTFRVYVDIGGNAKSGDYVKLYFDSKGDILATGKTYGYAVDPDIIAFDTAAEAHSISLQGGDITITFNGPVTGDIAIRGQDVELYRFTIVVKNNVEVRNLRFKATTTGSTATYTDVKVWDTSNNSVVTSARNLDTSDAGWAFADVLNLNAGQTKTFKLTADVDATNSPDGTVKITLAAFTDSDIKNLDNNQFVTTTNIVPSTDIAGNNMTVKAPTLDVQLAAIPSSQTYVQGAADKELVGFSFRAISADIRLSSVKVTASSSSATLTSGEVQSLALYDGSSRISDIKSLSSSDLTVTFDNLNLTINKGVTKVLTLKGNISANATNHDKYYFYIAAVNSSNISVTDKDGNSILLTPSGVAINSGPTVEHLVTTVGDVSVVRATDDEESEAGIIVAGKEEVVAKFRFTATNENMTVNKMQVLINTAGNATATSTTVADEVPIVKLYDGATQIGATGGYVVQASGDNAGIAIVGSLGWVVPKDSSKTLTVKGALNTISGGADTGTSLYASIMSTGFEAQGSSDKDVSVGTAPTGRQKVVYKTRPSFTTLTAVNTALSTSNSFKFKMKAEGVNSSDYVAWKQIQFRVVMTGATLTAVDAEPLANGNIAVKRVGASSNLSIASAFSHTSNTTGLQIAIQGTTGYVSLLLSAEETIPVGTEQEYELTLPSVSEIDTGDSMQVSVQRTESTLVTATTVAEVRVSLGTATDAAPSIVWSDYSATGHAEDTLDWANGVLIRILPSPVTISK